MEIERKFLVEVVPNGLELCSKSEILQGYVAIADDGTEVRLRKRGERFFETIKSAGSVTRSEIEIELTKDQFERMWPATAGGRIEKTRHEIPAGNLVIEVDLYGGSLAGLVIAEVEFPDLMCARAFTPPQWFGKEVTENAAYKNRSLAVFGRPR